MPTSQNQNETETERNETERLPLEIQWTHKKSPQNCHKLPETRSDGLQKTSCPRFPVNISLRSSQWIAVRVKMQCLNCNILFSCKKCVFSLDIICRCFLLNLTLHMAIFGVPSWLSGCYVSHPHLFGSGQWTAPISFEIMVVMWWSCDDHLKYSLKMCPFWGSTLDLPWESWRFRVCDPHFVC